MKAIPFLCCTLLMLSGRVAAAEPTPVRLGVDLLLSDSLALIQGKRLGLITNATGLTSNHESTIDALVQTPGVQLVALFGPEHGVRGDAEAGKAIDNYVDEKTGIMVYSLYGRNHKPTPEMLRGVDLLLYDIQDIGSRAYTYIYTMARGMEAARENHIPFVVLDRPDPMGGDLVEGGVLDPRFKSGIGLYPIPFIYGMTVGELAQLFNREFGIDCDLKVIRLAGWQRHCSFEETGLMWVPTSPHIPEMLSVWYCATVGCLGELQQVDVGVGMPGPFEYIGAPWIKGENLAVELNRRQIPGVFFRPVHYRPFYGIFKGVDLEGVQIHLLDHHIFRPMQTQLHILAALQRLYPDRNIYDTPRLDMFMKAIGTDQVHQRIRAGAEVDEILIMWREGLEQFMTLRQKYLLYP
ncbi:MAG TPA: DUF1343 domain-containing protein [bacterium]|nr:DUF1343 domain-containing protein [bacterium]HQI47490.1 DUF1343 domain-containing protein [bacterium]HQJ65756.1 DUF1343 domain-containing protein [bacterium]